MADYHPRILGRCRKCHHTQVYIVKTTIKELGQPYRYLDPMCPICGSDEAWGFTRYTSESSVDAKRTEWPANLITKRGIVNVPALV
jgi:hypothetical protein